MTGIAVEGVGTASTVTTTGATTDIAGEPVQPNPPAEVTVKSVTVTAADSATTVEAGKELTLTASVKDEDGNEVSDVTVSWIVTGGSDTKIDATDNDSKTATLTVGKNETKDTKLTITASVGDVKSENLEVTVTEAATPEAPEA